MGRDHWSRLRDLFERLQAMPSPERDAFLDRELVGEPELRAELEALLVSESAAVGFLVDQEGPVTGSIVGPYRLIEPLGEGGFGVVYLAEQTHPIRRRVALKLIKPGMDTRQVISRFKTEQQALAQMDHVRHSCLKQVRDCKRIAIAGYNLTNADHQGGEAIVRHNIIAHLAGIWHAVGAHQCIDKATVLLIAAEIARDASPWKCI